MSPIADRPIRKASQAAKVGPSSRISHATEMTAAATARPPRIGTTWRDQRPARGRTTAPCLTASLLVRGTVSKATTKAAAAISKAPTLTGALPDRQELQD